MLGRKLPLVSLGSLPPWWIQRRRDGHVDDAPRSQQWQSVELDRRSMTEDRAGNDKLQCVAPQVEAVRRGRRDMNSMRNRRELRAAEL